LPWEGDGQGWRPDAKRQIDGGPVQKF